MIEAVHVYSCPGCRGDDVDIIQDAKRGHCHRCGLWFWL